MNVRRVLPRVEALEGRDVPSSMGMSPPAPVAVMASQTQDQHRLAGTGHGDATRGLVIDAGARFQLQGTAHLSRQGDFMVSGWVQGVGFIRSGHAQGSLTFTNHKGSITVSLTGPPQDGFAPLPDRFVYQVTSATGAYAGLQDRGGLKLTVTADSLTHATFRFVI